MNTERCDPSVLRPVERVRGTGAPDSGFPGSCGADAAWAEADNSLRPAPIGLGPAVHGTVIMTGVPPSEEAGRAGLPSSAFPVDPMPFVPEGWVRGVRLVKGCGRWARRRRVP
ncbi:hypothetical protein GCM10025734_05030 [Kitasatospora paranensis]